MKELTRRQKEVYDFIKEYAKKNGYPPTIREISSHFGFSSPSGALVHIEALQKKGYIKRDHASRGIRLITEPSLEISVVEVIGIFLKDGKIKESVKKNFIPLPDEKTDLIGTLSGVDLPNAGILKDDYVIFEKNAKRDGIALAKIANSFVVGTIKRNEFKDLSGKKYDNFKIIGSFYGILRVPKREGMR